jgi:hypothetical protein
VDPGPGGGVQLELAVGVGLGDHGGDGRALLDRDSGAVGPAGHTGPFMGLAPTNRPFAYRQVHLIRFQDGKGVEHWAVRDDLSFLRQVGALPSQPAGPVPADA